MKELYIHVGTGKTATTLLQNRVFNRHEGLNYLGKTKESYPDWLIRWHYLDDYAFEKEHGAISGELEKRLSEERPNLISSEVFYMYGGGCLQQARRIKAVAPYSRIIIVLRDPIDQIVSRYSYSVKADGFMSPLEDLVDFKRTPFVFYKRKPFYMPDMLYDEAIDVYERLFGKDNLCVLKYEDMIKFPDKFFSALASFMSVSFDMEELKESMVERVNESPGGETLGQIRAENAYNLLKTQFPGAAQRLDLSDFEQGRTSNIMDDELKEKIRAYLKGKCQGYY